MRNTALLYDVENLVGGYGMGLSDRTGAISLRDIETRIASSANPPVGRYAIKRAYADWSSPGLRPLRHQIVAGGVDARQTFAFGQRGRKNAADVELVLDAITIALTQSTITHFVIVSADGGFGALVRALHEHGRTVTVAGYRENAGDALIAVCDTFVDLPIPAAVALKSGSAGAQTITPAPPATRGGLAAALPPAPVDAVRDREPQIATMRRVVEALATHEDSARQLAAGGISVATLGQVAYDFVDATSVKQHFRGLLALLDEAVAGTGISVVHEPGRERLTGAWTPVATRLAA